MELATQVFNAERAHSLQFRLKHESMLISKALERPILGWDGHRRNRIVNRQGKDVSITDGFWVIVLGVNGLVGLASLTLLVLLGPLLFLWRVPNKMLLRPELAPYTGFVLISSLQMIDNLFNAMLIPIHALALGGITTYLQRSRR